MKGFRESGVNFSAGIDFHDEVVRDRTARGEVQDLGRAQSYHRLNYFHLVKTGQASNFVGEAFSLARKIQNLFPLPQNAGRVGTCG